MDAIVTLYVVYVYSGFVDCVSGQPDCDRIDDDTTL